MNEDDQPDWYMTPDEFIDVVAAVARDFFSSGSYAIGLNKTVHPEDIATPFSMVVEVVACTLVELSRREGL